MHTFLRSLILLAVITLDWIAPKTCEAQSEVPRVFNGSPAAFWVFHPDIPGSAEEQSPKRSLQLRPTSVKPQRRRRQLRSRNG